MTADSREQRNRFILILGVLAIAFGVRAAVVLVAAASGGSRAFYAPDSTGYVALAEELCASGRFGPQGRPEIVRTPGYPLFLLLGVSARRVEAVAISLQVMLSCLTVWFVYHLGQALFGGWRAAFFGALLYALEPLSVAYSSLLLSETLFTCLTAAFLLGLVRHLHGGGAVALVGAAVTLAAAVYVRPVGYFLPVLVAAGLCFGRPAWRVRLVRAGIFLAVAALPIAAWQVRNAAVAGYGGFSAIADINSYFYHGAAVAAARDGVPYYDMQNRLGYRDEALYLAAHPEQTAWTPAQRYRWMGGQGRRLASRHPLLFGAIYARGVVRAALDPGAIEYLKLFGLYQEGGGVLGAAVDKGLLRTAVELRARHPAAFWSSIALGIVLLALLALAFIGVARRQVIRSAAVIAVILVSACFMALSGGPSATGRFRHPIMPAVCAFAGAGLMRVVRKPCGGGPKESQVPQRLGGVSP